MTSIAIHPNRLPEAPAFAIQKVLNYADLTLENTNLIEINEAFAAVPLVSLLLLAGMDKKKNQILKHKTNINGGAIAIGHPNTASGARLIMTMIYELRRRGGGYGVAAICGGLAQADACVIRV
jgi:acetyl-CoA C-acetyltransferase